MNAFQASSDGGNTHDATLRRWRYQCRQFVIRSDDPVPVSVSYACRRQAAHRRSSSRSLETLMNRGQTLLVGDEVDWVPATGSSSIIGARRPIAPTGAASEPAGFAQADLADERPAMPRTGHGCLGRNNGDGLEWEDARWFFESTGRPWWYGRSGVACRAGGLPRI